MRGFFVDFLFFFNSALLGVGLAMDAFSVSAANGLAEPNMKKSKEFSISGTFAFFQFLMPMLGWVLVRFTAEQFTAFQKAVPYIALVLLLFIGGKMLYEGIKNKGDDDINGEKGEETTAVTKLTLLRLFVQGIATSIDALSVGFTIAEYKVTEAARLLRNRRGGDVRNLRRGNLHRKKIRNETCGESNHTRRRNSDNHRS